MLQNHSRKIYTVGLTGGIGSGKSTVANFFQDLGITIIDADVIARELVIPNSPALKKIVDHFGTEILDSSDQLNRQELHGRIFQNPSERLWLEQLLHPAILEEIKHRAQKSTSPYCIAVVPLLLETKLHSPVDRILVVDSPIELQRQRVQQRDNHSDQIIDAILETQLSREQRLSAADDVIVNNKGIEELKQQVKNLHENYIKWVNAGN
jgi:dephospho-CoA kinase